MPFRKLVDRIVQIIVLVALTLTYFLGFGLLRLVELTTRPIRRFLRRKAETHWHIPRFRGLPAKRPGVPPTVEELTEFRQQS